MQSCCSFSVRSSGCPFILLLLLFVLNQLALSAKLLGLLDFAMDGDEAAYQADRHLRRCSGAAEGPGGLDGQARLQAARGDPRGHC